MSDQQVLTYSLKHLGVGLESSTYSKWKRHGLQKKKKSETLHAKHGGLFRCQEVCVMVIGQMREEGWNRPLCFEDSPSPPRPVQLHHSHPTPKPRNRRDQRDLTFMCTCLCMHLFFVCYTFPGLCIYAAIAVLYGCKWITKKSTHRRCLVFSKQQEKKSIYRWLNCNPGLRIKLK